MNCQFLSCVDVVKGLEQRLEDARTTAQTIDSLILVIKSLTAPSDRTYEIWEQIHDLNHELMKALGK